MIEQNEWIELHLEDLDCAWNDWAHKETEVFFDEIDFHEFCFFHRNLSPSEWQQEYKRRVRRGIGQRMSA